VLATYKEIIFLLLMNLKTIRKTSISGGSLQITLPSIWVQNHQLQKGCGIVVEFLNDGSLKLEVDK